MNTTSASLLMRLRQPGQAEAWTRFVRLYSPLLYSWARRMGLQDADAEDLVQEVFTTLFKQLPEFGYDNQKRFRGWLWTVTRNTWLKRRERSQLPVDHAQKAEKLLAPADHRLEEEEFHKHLLIEFLPTVQAHFHATTWQAFWEHVVNEKPVAQVAKELGLTVANVYKAKVRVLSRLHKELGEWTVQE